MPTMFIDNRAIDLPIRITPENIASEYCAKILNMIVVRRVRARLVYLWKRGELAIEEIPAKARELVLTLEMLPYMAGDDDEDTDPVVAEAMHMAREMIVAHMAAEGLPSPRNIDDHARELVNNMPDMLARARIRVEARYRAANEALGV